MHGYVQVFETWEGNSPVGWRGYVAIPIRGNDGTVQTIAEKFGDGYGAVTSFFYTEHGENWARIVLHPCQSLEAVKKYLKSEGYADLTGVVVARAARLLCKLHFGV